MNDGLFRKLGKFETHHHILFFTIIMLGTVLLVRSCVQFYNPNPIIMGFELHHFDYGIIILLVVVILLLFGNRRHQDYYLILAAVGSGLVIDDYLFIKKSMVENHVMQTAIYNSTIPYAVLIIIASILIILFVNSAQKRH